jgi:hypothetical protein
MRVHEDPLRWVALTWAAMAAGLFFARRSAGVGVKDPASEASAACVVAVAAHVQRSVSPDGALHTTSFRERVYRCAGSVWTERLRAPEYFRAAEPPPGEAAFPALELARFVTRTADGGTTLLLVSRARRQAIEVAPDDFARAGFDGSWDGASHLLPKAGLVPVTVSTAPEHDGEGCRWLESTSTGRRARVLFCDEIDMPLEIHFEEAPDGTTEDVSVQVLPLAPDAVPWRGVGDFHRSSSSDVPG